MKTMQVNRLENYNRNFISFKAMKKSQFKGIDRMIVEQYKAPIERFNGHDEFQKFCKGLVKEITEHNYGGRRPQTNVQRKGMLKEWFEYVTLENDAYTDSIALMILKAITKPLKHDNDNLPPVLHKGILANTVEEVQKDLENGSQQNIDFEKSYIKNLQKNITEDYGLNEDQTGWIIIPSLKNDSDNFEKNVEKLKILSHPNWCTKSFNAQPYLSDGDFHVYVEDGKPVLGVRFYGDSIQEIQGPNNDGKIPPRYFGMIDYFKKYPLSDKAKGEIRELAKIKWRIFKRFPRGIENYSTEKILKKCGIKCKKDSDGMLIISELESSFEDLSLWDIGLNINKILKEVKEIKGNADFNGANTFGNVRVIGGYAHIMRTGINSLGKLEYVGQGLAYSEYKDVHVNLASELKPRMINYIRKNLFPKGVENYSTQEILEKFGIKCKKDSDGMLIISDYHQPLDNYREHITYSELGIDENKMFNDIKKIEGNANMHRCSSKNLGNIKEIGGALNIHSPSEIEDISGLEFAGWNINIDDGTKIDKKDIFEVQNRTNENFKKTHFPNGIENYSTKEILETFGFKCRKKIFGKDRGKLVVSHYRSPMNPNLNLSEMGIDENKLFEDIVEIKKYANLSDTNVTNLGSLKKVGQLYLRRSKLKECPNLKYVKKDVELDYEFDLHKLDNVKINDGILQ